MSALQLGLFSPRWQLAAPAVRAPDLVDPFLTAHAEKLSRAGIKRLSFEWLDDAPRSAVGVDVEVFKNFFVACFKRFSDGAKRAFELSARAELDRAGLEAMLRDNLTVSFNGFTYDLPIISLAVKGATNRDLKLASDRIINGNLKPWEVEKELGYRLSNLNHVDLIEPNPSVRQGLKMLEGRLHSRFLVDLPFDPEAWLTFEEMNVATLYCFNDVDATELLREAMREALELRVALGKEYGMDLRSRSDAQIGEAIVKKRVELITKKRVERGPDLTGTRFKYVMPSFISFKGDRLLTVAHRLAEVEFAVSGDKVRSPPFLDGLKVEIGRSTYSMGIGGLHSTEAHRSLVSTEDRSLIDVDVSSQYPNIIRNLSLYPIAIGPTFLDVYGKIVDERLAAKAAGAKVKADGLKISVNGVFGKLGSPYSPLYAPDLLIAVTLTGQLSILMLIEMAENAGIEVVSANTDGVVFNVPRVLETELDAVVAHWESEVGFSIERTRYRALYSSSVNSYLAVRDDGKVKIKGPLADPWTENDPRGQMQKNPQMTICSQALARFVADGVLVEDTIVSCQDPRAFVTVIRVTGGAAWRGRKLGRVVRYYWSIDGEPIRYAGKANKVAKTDGARPLMELTGELPPDLDRLRYCEETARLAVDYAIKLNGS